MYNYKEVSEEIFIQFLKDNENEIFIKENISIGKPPIIHYKNSNKKILAKIEDGNEGKNKYYIITSMSVTAEQALANMKRAYMKSDFKRLKVGALVWVNAKYREKVSLEKVAEVEKYVFIVQGVRYNRSTGFIVGNSGHYISIIKDLTPEIKMQYQIARLENRIRDLQKMEITPENYDKINRQVAAVEYLID